MCVACAGAPGVSGCAALGATGGATGRSIHAAERGDLVTLRAEIAAKERAGALSNDDAAKIARAVVAREVDAAKGDEARARVRELRGCASSVDDVLAERMRTHDAAGAEAALARAESGELSAGDARRFAADGDDQWRAVGARALTREEDRDARAHALLDAAPEVRRAAIRAARDAKDAKDLDTLFAAARLDPEPRVRTEAVRALASLGGARVVAKLRDLWAGADDPVREDIAQAWAAPAVRGEGGRDELRLLLAAGHGPAAIDGAGAVLRGGARDAEIDGAARALLGRTIASASTSTRDRLHAIAVTPITPAAGGSRDALLLDALRSASKEADVDVAVAALARLTESPPDRGAAVAALESLAGTADHGATASRARFALANAGDARVQAWLEADLDAKTPSARLSALDALIALGRSARGAPLLADPDPHVRTRAACALVTSTRRATRR